MDTHPSLPQDLWEQTPPEVRAYIVALEARVTALESMAQALQEQNRALQEQRNQTSRNSSRPPSSDPPSSPRPKHPRSQRRRGGQPGHPGQTRTLIPGEDVDQIVPLKPEQCPDHYPHRLSKRLATRQPSTSNVKSRKPRHKVRTPGIPSL